MKTANSKNCHVRSIPRFVINATSPCSIGETKNEMTKAPVLTGWKAQKLGLPQFLDKMVEIRHSWQYRIFQREQLSKEAHNRRRDQEETMGVQTLVE